VRAYLRRRDVAAGVLQPSDTRSAADPYLGSATHWHVDAGGERFADGARSYEDPPPEAAALAGRVCFEGDGIAVRLDA
jgi:uncharacterized protein (DUF427 family)